MKSWQQTGQTRFVKSAAWQEASSHREADLKLAPRQDKIKPLPVQVAERFIFQMQANVWHWNNCKKNLHLLKVRLYSLRRRNGYKSGITSQILKSKTCCSNMLYLTNMYKQLSAYKKCEMLAVGSRAPRSSNVYFQLLKNCLKMMVSFPWGRISTCRQHKHLNSAASQLMHICHSYRIFCLITGI